MVQHPAPRKWHGRPGYISWPKIEPLTQPSQQAVQVPHCRAPAARAGAETCLSSTTAPQHFLYFFPLPQGQGSFRPIAIGTSLAHALGLAHPNRMLLSSFWKSEPRLRQVKRAVHVLGISKLKRMLLDIKASQDFGRWGVRYP